ncbi:MAG TPA: hypothetical protein PK499_09590 [Flavobacteriales bacterium]|nr:hypothetical protein [Flavobacteriales bacterium]
MRVLGLAGLLALGVAQAQEPVYRWGPPVTNDHTERRIERLLALGDDGFVLLRTLTDATTVKHYWLERYSKDLAHVSTEEVEFHGGVMGDSRFLDAIEVVNGRLVAFVTHWHKDSGKHTLLMHDLALDGTLGEGRELDVIAAEKMGNRGFFSTAFSPDGTKLAVLADLPYEKNMQGRVRLSCFDPTTGERLWNKEQELDWGSEKAPRHDLVVDDKGRAYLFKQTWQKPVWMYALYSTNGSDWLAHRTKHLDGKQVEDHRMAIGPEGQAFVYALYTTEPSNYDKRVHGSWYALFGPDGSLAVDRAEGWPREVVAMLGSEHLANNAEKAHVKDLRIKDVLGTRPGKSYGDGRLLVLLEQVEEKSDPVAGSSPMQYTYSWVYDDALVLSLDASSGDLDWWRHIDKHQEVRSSTPVDEFGSYLPYLKEDRLFLFWNNTDLSVPSIPPAGWTEPDGTKYVKKKAFDEKTAHGTFLYVIEPDGHITYGDRTHGLPLLHLHEGAVFEMSLTTPFFFDANGQLVVLAQMHNGGQRYRFGFIGL